MAQRGAKPAAFDAQQRSIVERINVYLTTVHTLIGDFVQVGPDGRRAEGKFYLQKPGRMRFEYNDPNPLELVADGKSVAIRDRRLATQDLLLLSQTPLRFLLSDRIDLLKEGNLVNVYQDDVFLTVVIDEKQALGGTHRLHADVLDQGHPAQAVDRDRSAGLRHHGRALQSRLQPQARSRPVPDQLRAHARIAPAALPKAACSARPSAGHFCCPAGVAARVRDKRRRRCRTASLPPQA